MYWRDNINRFTEINTFKTKRIDQIDIMPISAFMKYIYQKL